LTGTAGTQWYAYQCTVYHVCGRQEERAQEGHNGMDQALKNNQGCNGVVRVPSRTAPSWPPAWLEPIATPEPDPTPDSATVVGDQAQRATGFRWSELSAQRWGPAAGDPEPGIDIPSHASVEPVDFTADDCPPWVDDPSLSVSMEDVRSSIAECSYLDTPPTSRKPS
jgi:hypothetical protein